MTNEKELLPYLRMMMAAKLSSTEEEWLGGYECGSLEGEETSNPYSENSQAYMNWSDGWWAGFYHEEPLFNYDGPAASVTPYAEISSTESATVKSRFSQANPFGKLVSLGALIVQMMCAVFVALLAYEYAN